MIAAIVLAALSALVHHSIFTSSTAAQSAFDDGLLMLDSYNQDEATRDFNAAFSADPHCAMAEWGIALASGTDLNTPLDPQRFVRAQAAAQRALSLERYASGEERGLIEAVAARYAGAWNDHVADEARYRAKMAAVVAAYPNDPDAKMLYAEALMEAHGTAGLWKADGAAATSDTQTILALIGGVLHADPQHLMANHLCIHAYDFARDRRPAIRCADRLMNDALPFEAEHLAHMPAHAYIESGDYAKALAASDRAWRMASTKYAPHDAYVGWNAAMMLGDETLAQQWAQRFGAAGGVPVRLTTLARFGRWNAIAAAVSQPDLYRPFAAGMAYAHLGDLSRAKQALQQLNAGASADLRDLLQAQIDERSGHEEAAAASLNAAIAFQKAADTAESLPLFPAGEALGALYLRAGRLADARSAFARTLADYPNDPRALYGLALTLQRLGDAASAQATMKAFGAQWDSGAPPALQDL